MKRSGLVAALLIVSVFAVGCDTTQPLRTGPKTVSVSFVATATQQGRWNVYELWEDVDADGVPDMRRTSSPTAFCEPAGPITSEPGLVPWPYAVEVAVLRAGETTPEVIATTFDSGGSTYTSSTPFSTVRGPTPPPRPPSGNIYFVNPVNVTRASFEYLTAEGSGCGNIPVGQLLPANLAGLSPPEVSVDLSPGDTILVRARKQDSDNPQFGSQPTFLSEPTLSAELLVDGNVAADAVGQFDTEIDVPGAGLAFSFTLN